jgi:hypothetical protein
MAATTPEDIRRQVTRLSEAYELISQSPPSPLRDELLQETLVAQHTLRWALGEVSMTPVQFCTPITDRAAS